MADRKRRVHHLAKDLLVSSKTIIEKCHAEGIEIKNHMHVVSAGLEATVREWFSEGEHTTTLEETQRVDLKAVRVKPKRKKKIKVAAAPSEGGGVAVAEAPKATEEAQPPTVKKKKKKKAIETPTRKSPRRVAAEAPEKTTLEEAGAVAVVHGQDARATGVEGVPEPVSQTMETAVEQEEGVEVAAPPAEPGETRPPAVAASAPEAPPAEPSPPPKPAVAGPQNIPKPAQLSGPKVVRIERPDFVEAPRPASRPPVRPRAETPAPRGEEDAAERARRRGRGPGEFPGRAGGTDAATAAGKRAHPRRSLHDTRDLVNEKLREWRDRDLIERRERLDHASGRGIGGLRAIEGKAPTRRGGQRAPRVLVKKDKVEMAEPIIVKDLSREAGILVNDIVKRLMQEGVMAGTNSVIDADQAQLITADYGIELTVTQAKSGLEKLAEAFAAMPRKRLEPRPPVVTVLGHVDHGKTSLLDRIRATSIAEGESGGITQHIGAYRVRVGDKWVTFLDTPGHAAFTAMRARGANLTDVVVLVVAADDGVMPTTVEAINHAKAAGALIVVALNKIDLPHDLNKIFGQLAEKGLTPTGDWGGDTDVIKTSAVTGEGVDELLAHLATLSEVMELRADPTLPACGTVVEAERSGRLGNVARVLVQEGTLKRGDAMVCGAAYGRVRSLRDDRGRSIKQAGPSMPVEVTGLSDVPAAGDRFYVVDSLGEAKEVAEEAGIRRRERELVRLATPTDLDSVLASAADGDIPELNVIIRADVHGSADVLKETLTVFPADQVKLRVLHAGVGVVTESDVLLAQASKAVIIAFHVVPEPAVAKMAENEGVDIRSYRVIYRVVDDIRKALEGLLEPEQKVELRGRAEVREVFHISRVGKIAGCFVREGVISRTHMVRVLRDGVVVRDEGAIGSLRRFKEDAKEVKNGFECGIRVADYDDVKPGDIIEAFERVQVAKTLAM